MLPMCNLAANTVHGVSSRVVTDATMRQRLVQLLRQAGRAMLPTRSVKYRNGEV
jgi:hypothetical protein